MIAVADIMQINVAAINRSDDIQIIRGEVIFSVLVMKFEIGVVFLFCPRLFFFFIQPHPIMEIMRAVMVWTFIGSMLPAFFPFKESVFAVRAKVSRLFCSFGIMGRACVATDFAEHLR